MTSMTIDQSYNAWANQYDTNENKTRDLEKIVAQKTLGNLNFKKILELGCGTGKNTEWLAKKTESLLAVDFSAGMLYRAKQKINSPNVTFQLADINKEWDIENNSCDLITCSLVLEHVQDLNFIYLQASSKLRSGGLFYICELHPYKQYNGTKARYTEGDETFELEVYIHNVSDFISPAFINNLHLLQLNEWFDDVNNSGLPRLISFLFKKA